MSKDVPEGYKVLKEGKASILQKGNDVFYNEAQVTNRDLSTCILRRFVPQWESELKSGKLKRNKQRTPKGAPGPKPSQEKVNGARVLEGLAASGLRSIRYAMEVPGIGRIDANDLDAAVVESMKRNIEFNGGDAQAKIHTLCEDARVVMIKNPQTYDVVDLDPYGTPAQLLDTAVQSVTEGGLMLVTATDMANLCGNNGVAAFSNYGCYPVHRPYCHEMALRILLACIEMHANRYKRHIVPLLSVSVDFYVRVFVRVYTSPEQVKESPGKLAYLWQSSGCDSFWLQRIGQKKGPGKFLPGHGPPMPDRCPDTGSGYLMGGPIWAEPIHDMEFVKGVLSDLERDKAMFAQYSRIKGLLMSVLDELPDAPLYYDMHDVCKTVRCQPPKLEVFRSALINAGYRVSGSHANPLALKTDAPNDVLWDIVRCWLQQHPAPAATKDPESYSAKLLAKEPKIKASFTRAAAAIPKAKTDGVPRFVQNPAFWGPKARHGRPDGTRPGEEGEAGPSTSGGQQQQGKGKNKGKDKGRHGQQQQQQQQQGKGEQQQQQEGATAGEGGQEQKQEEQQQQGAGGGGGDAAMAEASAPVAAEAAGGEAQAAAAAGESREPDAKRQKTDA